MNLLSSVRRGQMVRCYALFVAALISWVSALHGQNAASSVTGRVQDAKGGGALENARVTIAGTNRQAFTDAFGDYRLAGLPAGTVTLQVFYTGTKPQSVTVTLAPGETVRRDFTLVPAAAAQALQTSEGVLKLDQFVVDSARDTNAASIAINEQRFANNLKTVLSTDALGDVIQNNLGEFVKFLPGVDVGTDQMNSVQIGLRGLPSTYTNIALDGEDVNAAGSAGPTRNTLLQAFSLSNAARVEISKVPTPDMSAASLGGSINMVSRTAFEASRPELRFKAYVNQNSHEFNFRRMSGAADGDDQARVFHYQPDFDFSYTVPVSKTFGFSINAVKNDQFGSARRINRTFSTSTAATNPLKSTIDNPFLTTLQYNVFPVYEHRYSLGTRIDWKATPFDTLSFTYSGNWLVQDYEQHNATFNTGTNPISWGPDFTHGRPGSGTVTVANTARYVRVRNNIFRLNHRRIGEKWDITSGLAYNFSDQTYRANSHRQFEAPAGRIQAATIDYDGFSDFLPGKLSVRDASGQAIDPFNLDSYRFFLNAGSGTRDNDSTARSAKFDVKRKFFTEHTSFAVKLGASTAEQYRARRNTSFTPIFVGKDGVANTADDSFAAQPFSLLNQAMLSFPMPRGMTQVQYPSSRRAWQLFEQYPQYFDVTTNRRTDIRTFLTNNEQMTERIDAAFLMSELSLWNNRFRIVAGVRYERTTDDGKTVLQDNNAKYQRDAAGNLILGPTKKPILIYPNAATNQADGIAEDALVYKLLGARLRKEYGDFYPSINATYNITENFLGRLGLAQTVGRPDFANILGATNVNQVDFDPNSSATGSALGTITTKNPALKPWKGNSLDIRLEYYTPNGGEISAGFYRKQIKDFFATQNFLATPEFLSSIGLSNEFEDYMVSAPSNINGIAHITGWEVNVNMPLSTVTKLNFARSVRVFANTTLVRNQGPAEADFRGFTPKMINWGFNYSRRPLTLTAKWTLVGKKRVGTIAAGNIGAAGWNYQAERLRLDLSADWRLNARYALYATGRNVFNDRDQNYAYAIGSPRYVKFAAEGEYGVNFQFGIKGNF